MHDPSNPPARVDLGSGYSCNLYRKPMAMPVTEPGKVVLALGEMPSGRLLTITVLDLEYLDRLESAVQAARAAGVVEAGMHLAVRP